MNPVEAAKALSIASAYDNRTVTEQAAVVWADALHDLSLPDVVEAIKEHFSRSDAYLMPKHIRDAVSRIRAKRLDDVGVPTPNVNPDDSLAFAKELRALTAAVASGEMDSVNRARYEQGGWTLSGAPARYAVNAPLVSRPAIAAAFGSVFRDAKGGRRTPRAKALPAQPERDPLAEARARIDAEAQS